ncbi:MAG: Endo-alpha-N-acetylgalactosaminidase [Candidatus Ordinivivax streblomastigis]|uniref:Endo-alpha-N-acetylgalactosaminidase n=1 Tax=Candidatus Ordinivivax streblomastigis TaxID=2540710 RepID=A0A5M8P3W5_9BACT|nr:MAG: Endo-alpha-N-acetylgalactosaminidase [Candidatus Ordinivivax streblomastigis]
MKTLKITRWCVCLLLAGTLPFILSACKEPAEEIEPFLTLTPESGVDFTQEALVKFVQVSSSTTNWSAKVTASGDDWCTLTEQKDKSRIEISVTENDGMGVRETVIEVVAGKLNKQFAVRQMGSAPAILVSPAQFTFDLEGGDMNFAITSNVEYTFSHVPDWVAPKTDLRASGMVKTEYAYTVNRNASTEERNDSIVIFDEKSGCRAGIAIVQAGDNYIPEDSTGIKKDIKIKITGGDATSAQSGEGIEKSFDGDYTTLYHSSWSNSGSNYFPITLNYYLGNADVVNYCLYYPRPSGENGLFKETEIYVRHTNSSSFEKVMDKDFRGSTSITYVEFTPALQNVNAIRFVVKSGAGGGQGFASCSEMEFYKKSSDSFDALTLFTDLSCSELKPGITEAQIEQCTNPFFKNIALYMFRDIYPREFRINEFHAYPPPTEDASPNKISQYDMFDNVTGISVKAGDELVILADGISGNYPVSIKIQNLVSEGDGFNTGQSFPLFKGMNAVTVQNDGLLYVMYHAHDFESAPQLKLHFATGKVNGYFDGRKHTKTDWIRLISNAIDPHFDLIGEYAHITYPTQSLRSYAGNRGDELMKVYDRLAYLQMEFEGMTEYGWMRRNHAYVNVNYGGGIYAADNHIVFTFESLKDVASPSRILNESGTTWGMVWGLGHEWGHQNQVRPGFRWKGMVEVTNNLQGLYAQYTMHGPQFTRFMKESESGYCNGYEEAINKYFPGAHPHNDQSISVFCKLVPFWQIRLYMDIVLGKKGKYGKGFYQDIYNDIRLTPKSVEAARTEGQHQLEFVKTICRFSELNLEDFFTHWGFLTPMDETVDDYGEAPFQVKQADINATLTTIRQYPKPAHSPEFQYISDLNTDLYKSGAAITEGTAKRNTSSFTFTNWKNVTAYEVRDGSVSGALKFVVMATDRTEFPFPRGASWNSAYKVYAVSTNGTRVEVKF